MIQVLGCCKLGDIFQVIVELEKFIVKLDVDSF
jgi:hypothetical protein